MDGSCKAVAVVGFFKCVRCPVAGVRPHGESRLCIMTCNPMECQEQAGPGVTRSVRQAD